MYEKVNYIVTYRAGMVGGVNVTCETFETREDVIDFIIDLFEEDSFRDDVQVYQVQRSIPFSVERSPRVFLEDSPKGP